MKMFYIIVLILFIEGCNINYFQRKKTPTTDEKYVVLVNLEVKSLINFMKINRKEDVVFDLVLFEADDEVFDIFGVLTLESTQEVKMVFIYNMKYLYSIMRIMSYEISNDDYDWSWNMVLINIKHQLQADKNRKSENFKPTEIKKY